MSKRITRQVLFGCSVGFLILLVVARAYGQRPQDNWYQDEVWVKTMAVAEGGLTEPYGVAIGADGRVYVGDQGQGEQRIQVYLPDGTFSFGITNGFGGGLKLNQPRGMITDNAGNLYVADYGMDCVFVFSGNGTFIRKIGNGTGSGNGQLSGVIDMAVSPEGRIYVLENGNARVSVFNLDGTFEKILIGPGTLDGQLESPSSIAFSESGVLCIAQSYLFDQGNTPLGLLRTVKTFNTNGVFLLKISAGQVKETGGALIYWGPCSVRVDRSGLLHVFSVVCGRWYNGCPDWSTAAPPTWMTCDLTGSQVLMHTPVSEPGMFMHSLPWPCIAVGADGAMIFCSINDKKLHIYRQALREQWAPPRNSIPMPAVLAIRQRPQSPLVDIDFQITDTDDSTVQAEALVFKNGVQAISNCIHKLTWVEGTATNLGSSIAANVPHRVTWDAGADWGIDLGSYRVAILAKDRRQNLLDIHYLRLKDEQGQPKMTISRSPLIQSDFMQAWWWFLANNDSAISITSGRVCGVTGSYTGKIMCSNEMTTADGRAFIYERMNVREATVQELAWARAAATTNSVEVWTATRTVGERPKAVNEYGFDTGSWGADAWWVIAE